MRIARSRWRVPLAAVAVAAAALAASQAVGLGQAAAPARGTLTLYSAQHQPVTKALVRAFEQQTGSTVRVRFGDDGQLAAQLLAEGASSPADVFLAENSLPLTRLEASGRLLALDRSTLARVPAIYRSPAGQWVGVAARSAALVYNPKLVSAADLPRSILDLGKPSWKGKLALAPSEPDFQPVVAAVIKLKGLRAAERWLTAFTLYAQRFNDNEGIVAAVERGRIAVGVVNHYYWYQAAGEAGGVSKMASRLHYFAARDAGALVDVSGAAVLRSSKQSRLAQQFVAFLVSRQGQQALVRSGDWQYPLVRGVAARRELRPFARLSPPLIGLAALGDGRNALALMQRVGLL